MTALLKSVLFGALAGVVCFTLDSLYPPPHSMDYGLVVIWAAGGFWVGRGSNP